MMEKPIKYIRLTFNNVIENEIQKILDEIIEKGLKIEYYNEIVALDGKNIRYNVYNLVFLCSKYQI